MSNVSFGDDDSQSRGSLSQGSHSQGSDDFSETTRKRKRRLLADVAVALEIQEKCGEKSPKSTGVRQVRCYVESTTRRCAGKVWVSVDDVPLMVQWLHDQISLGGVSVPPEDGAESLATSGGEESATAESATS